VSLACGCSGFRFEIYILRVVQERNDLPRTFDGLLSEHFSILRCYSSFVCVPSDRGMAVRTEQKSHCLTELFGFEVVVATFV